jgi:L-ascorbate metabolism protein UlaG (beta-lactamase superfamily)
MAYPVSDHCDGQRFFNPCPPSASRGLMKVIRWRFRGDHPAWPTDVPNPPMPPPPATVPAGQAAVTFINHASFLIRLPDMVVLTDPIFSRRCSPVGWAGPARVRAPGIALADLPRIDLILLSHNHYDHMDLPSLRAVQQRHAPAVVTTLGNARPLRALGIDATELDWWQQTACGTLRFAARTPFDRNRTLWGGFMLHHADGRILFAGDSGAGPHWHAIHDRLGAPDVALLPIGAYEPRWFMAPVHMNPTEAVQAHQALHARQSVGMHFGTFHLTDEAIDAPLHALRDAIGQAAIAPASFVTLEHGETRQFMLAAA